MSERSFGDRTGSFTGRRRVGRCIKGVHALKLTLLISSLLTIILLVFAAGQENYFTEWRRTQRDYREILLGKAQKEKKIAARYSIELRQIVVPDLATVDRCVSCHVGIDDPRMTDAPQPFTFHPGIFLEVHDVDKFGCTGCHGGQGQATTRREAHADGEGIHWGRGLLPSPFNQSSCGVCHNPEALRSTAPELARGLDLFRANGCLGCHKLNDRGGGSCPPLDREGDKVKHEFPFARISGEKTIANWHLEHFKDPQRVVPGSKMPKVTLNDPDLEALVTYLFSLRKVNLTEQLIPRDKYEERYRLWHPESVSGEALYKQFCISCHGEGLETIIHETLGKMVPGIRNPDFLSIASEGFLFKNIHDGRDGTEMPAWGQPGGGLSDDEIRALVATLLAGKKGAAPAAPAAPAAFAPPKAGDVASGKRLFEAHCTACHLVTPGGDAPWLGSGVFQTTYSDASIGSVIKYGRAGSLMAPFGKESGGPLGDAEIADVVQFIRTLQGPSLGERHPEE